VSKPTIDPLFAEYWKNPKDDAALRVWADALIERGDPRGEYIQLCLVANPTAEQTAKRATLVKKAGGKLVGPAREYLREWSFGPNGLVDRARCEDGMLASGIDVIGALNPRLCLTVTSLKKKPIVAALGAVSLERIHYIDFCQNVMGSHGGTNISDKNLATLAPALAKVRHLALSCRGYADECFTANGLRTLGDKLQAIELLSISYHRSGEGPYEDRDRPRLPLFSEYADVITTSAGFHTLKVLFLDGNGVTKEPFAKLQKLKVEIGDGARAPGTADEIDEILG